MAIRTMWKGVLRIGSQRVPVRLFSAAEDRTVHFRLLHRKDGQPVQQQMVNAETGQVVDPAGSRKGIEVDRGVFVLLDPDELDSLEPKPSRDVDVGPFVPLAAIHHTWFDRPYYLGPDGDDAGYRSLEEVLEERGVAGIAHWVMRNKEYVGALTVHAGRLALVSLHFAEEIVNADEIEMPEAKDMNPKELQMAAQLMAMLEKPFHPAGYADTFRNEVRKLLDAKASGRSVRKPRARPKPKAPSLADALQASIAAATKEPHAEKKRAKAA